MTAISLFASCQNHKKCGQYLLSEQTVYGKAAPESVGLHADTHVVLSKVKDGSDSMPPRPESCILVYGSPGHDRPIFLKHTEAISLSNSSSKQ